MGSKYSSQSASGYNSSPPSDDGTITETNKVKYSTTKEKLADPVKVLADNINSALLTHFDTGPVSKVSTSTILLTHNNQLIEVSGATTTLNLSDASTLGAGWFCWIRVTGTSDVTLSRVTGGDTMNGVASDLTLIPKSSVGVMVNGAASGFVTFGADELPSVLTTAGDLVYASAANTPARLAVGTDGQVPSVAAGGTSFAYWTPDHFRGLEVTIGTDADHDIDISVGETTDSTNAYIFKLTGGLTKQIDAPWAVGTAAGGLLSGTVAASTRYYVYLMRKDSDGSIDAGMSTSPTASDIVSGYTAYALIKILNTDSLANIIYLEDGPVTARTGREKLLADVVITAATTNIDLSLVGNYEKYIIEYSRVRVSSDGVLWARYSDDDAATFKTGASDYVIPAGTSSEIILNPSTFTATLSCYSGTITISNKDFVSGVTASGLLSVVYSGYRAGTPSTADGTNSGVFNVASDVTDVRIKNSAGNITNGIFTLYGINR